MAQLRDWKAADQCLLTDAKSLQAGNGRTIQSGKGLYLLQNRLQQLFVFLKPGQSEHGLAVVVREDQVLSCDALLELAEVALPPLENDILLCLDVGVPGALPLLPELILATQVYSPSFPS